MELLATCRKACEALMEKGTGRNVRPRRGDKGPGNRGETAGEWMGLGREGRNGNLRCRHQSYDLLSELMHLVTCRTCRTTVCRM